MASAERRLIDFPDPLKQAVAMRVAIDTQDWRELIQRKMPTFASDELLLVAWRSGDAVLQAVRAGDFDRIPRAWGTAVLAPFVCGPAAHAFDEPAHSWANFREPQFTAGLAHFLSTGVRAVRNERVRSFLAAALRCAGAEPMARRVEACEIVGSEAVAEEARVDLVVQILTPEGEAFGVVMEAKFGHHLTRGQLPAARRHAATRGLTDDNAAFIVVLPDVADVGSAVFRKAGNRSWRAVSWWSLMTGIETGATAGNDDRPYRAFRHTLWKQTYG